MKKMLIYRYGGKFMVENLFERETQYFCSSETILTALEEILSTGDFNEKESEVIVLEFVKQMNQNDEMMPLLLINTVLMRLSNDIQNDKLAYLYEKLSTISHNG